MSMDQDAKPSLIVEEMEKIGEGRPRRLPPARAPAAEGERGEVALLPERYAELCACGLVCGRR